MLSERQRHGSQVTGARGRIMGTFYPIQHCQCSFTYGFYGAFLLPNETQQDMEGTDGSLHLDLEGLYQYTIQLPA